MGLVGLLFSFAEPQCGTPAGFFFIFFEFEHCSGKSDLLSNLLEIMFHFCEVACLGQPPS